jgi:hypothetical protein
VLLFFARHLACSCLSLMLFFGFLYCMFVYVSTFCSLFFVFMYGSCSWFVVIEFVFGY